MHNNYYFLRQLTKQLRDSFSGFRIHEIYSQQKDELIISLCRGEETAFLMAHLGSEFNGLSFPQSLNRARRNSVDLFKALPGLEIIDIIQIENDRSFYFHFEGDYKLLFKMHGNRSNIVLLQKDKVWEIFRNSLKKDFEIDINGLSKTIQINRELFLSHNGDYRKMLPTFGRDFDLYLLTKNYYKLSAGQQFDCIVGLLAKIESPDYYLHINGKKFPRLLLYPQSDEDMVFHQPMKALNALHRAFITDYYLEKEKSKLRSDLNEKITKGEAYITTSLEKLQKLHATASYSHIGNLIMANLHKIPIRQSVVELEDFYTQTPVLIRLNPNLSPQLNAEKYYKKARKQQIEIATLEKHIDARRQQIIELQAQIDHLSEIQSLRQFKKNLPAEDTSSNTPFHKVEFMDFEILIGKNAKTNEMLTFSVAAKDDLFLHAKDTPGSHVIIKAKSKRKFPPSVIEKAAAYAAFYSKSKGETLIRVLYTPKKYVRKAKGMPAGTVIASNEKVLLVSPEEAKK
jgi:predicted ribosome quality control (RQC) complex YloA/Tae2 family protein